MKDQRSEQRRNSHGSSEEVERELDEEMGVPDPRQLQEEIEKERKGSSSGESTQTDNRYLDASGMEKAER